MKLGWLDWIQTWITLALMKISICFFLLRIVDHKGARYFMHGMIAVLATTTALFCFLFFAICRPLNAEWTMGKDGKCLGVYREMQIIIAQGGQLSARSCVEILY